MPITLIHIKVNSTGRPPGFRRQSPDPAGGTPTRLDLGRQRTHQCVLAWLSWCQLDGLSRRAAQPSRRRRVDGRCGIHSLRSIGFAYAVRRDLEVIDTAGLSAASRGIAAPGLPGAVRSVRDTRRAQAHFFNLISVRAFFSSCGHTSFGHVGTVHEFGTGRQFAFIRRAPS